MPPSTRAGIAGRRMTTAGGVCIVAGLGGLVLGPVFWFWGDVFMGWWCSIGLVVSGALLYSVGKVVGSWDP